MKILKACGSNNSLILRDSFYSEIRLGTEPNLRVNKIPHWPISAGTYFEHYGNKMDSRKND